MRGTAAMALVASLTLGCVDALLGNECEDECSLDHRSCDGNQVQVCTVTWWVSLCTYWDAGENCSDRGAVCVDGQCVCPEGLADCGTCADLMTDPNHCGSCTAACAGVCVNGLCGPHQSPDGG